MSLYVIEWLNGDWEYPNESYIVELTAEQAGKIDAYLQARDEELDGELEPTVTPAEPALSYEYFVREHLKEVLDLDADAFLKAGSK